MLLITSLYQRYQELDEQMRKQYIFGILGAFGLLLVGMCYYHVSRVWALQNHMIRINRQRKQARDLFEQLSKVNLQKESVNEILRRDKSFKIKEYVTGIMQELNLSKKNNKAEVSDPQDLQNTYSEIKLGCTFTNITMQQLTEFLYKVEKNERVYTKELIITKAHGDRTIDVTLVIATLQSQAELT